MISEQKKQELNKMFEDNGPLWAKQEIRGVRFNAEKRQYLQFLLDKHESRLKDGEIENVEEKHIESLDQQKSSTKATWVVAIATIALVVVTIILVIVTYLH